MHVKRLRRLIRDRPLHQSQESDVASSRDVFFHGNAYLRFAIADAFFFGWTTTGIAERPKLLLILLLEVTSKFIPLKVKLFCGW